MRKPTHSFHSSHPSHSVSAFKDVLYHPCRWMEVIKSAASSTGRMSLLIPKVCPLEVNGN